MPPKAKITRDMIVDAAVGIVRDRGFESINARTVAERLHCSKIGRAPRLKLQSRI